MMFFLMFLFWFFVLLIFGPKSPHRKYLKPCKQHVWLAFNGKLRCEVCHRFVEDTIK